MEAELGERLVEKKSNRANSYLIFSVICAGATSWSLGYDLGVVADALPFIKDDLSLSFFQEQLFVGILNVVAAFGALAALATADALGRRATIMIACLCLISGVGITTGANGFVMLMVGRALTGIGIGISFVCVPIYITEISPAKHRGFFGTMFDISINLGIVCGYIVGYTVAVSVSGDSRDWRLMVGSGLVIPTLSLIGSKWLPESPRWLMGVSKNREEAKAVLDKLGDPDSESTLVAIEDEETRYREGPRSDPTTTAPAVRRAFLFVALLGICGQVNGSEAILYYADAFLKKAGLGSLRKEMLGEIAIGFSKLLGEVIMAFFVDGLLGRRICLLISALGCSLLLFTLALTYLLSGPGILVIGWLCMFMFFFSTGYGPYLWVLSSELLPTEHRTHGMVLAVFMNRLTSGIAAMTALSLVNETGYTLFFALYGTLALAAFAFCYAILPETKGKSLEELAERFYEE